jgi:hypothetical protein
VVGLGISKPDSLRWKENFLLLSGQKFPSHSLRRRFDKGAHAMGVVCDTENVPAASAGRRHSFVGVPTDDDRRLQSLVCAEKKKKKRKKKKVMMTMKINEESGKPASVRQGHPSRFFRIPLSPRPDAPRCLVQRPNRRLRKPLATAHLPQ